MSQLNAHPGCLHILLHHEFLGKPLYMSVLLYNMFHLSLFFSPPPLSLSLSPHLLSKVDPGLVLRVIPFLSYMMDDPSINVIKRLLVCVLHVYKLAIIVS